MKRLFITPFETYSEEGLELSNKVGKILEPIFTQYQNKGFSIRDIEYIIANEVHMLGAEAILQRNFNIVKKKKEKAHGNRT